MDFFWPEVGLVVDVRRFPGSRRHPHVAQEQIEGIRHFLSAGLTGEDRRSAALEMADESWLGRCAEMARLGVVASVQPAHLLDDRGAGEDILNRLTLGVEGLGDGNRLLLPMHQVLRRGVPAR